MSDAQKAPPADDAQKVPPADDAQKAPPADDAQKAPPDASVDAKSDDAKPADVEAASDGRDAAGLTGDAAASVDYATPRTLRQMLLDGAADADHEVNLALQNLHAKLTDFANAVRMFPHELEGELGRTIAALREHL